jgi:sarcosine oxidase subunit alpha
MRVTVNKVAVDIAEGTSVAAAVIASGAAAFRRSVGGEARYPLCGMGICFECRVSIDGITKIRSCLIEAVDGMEIETE